MLGSVANGYLTPGLSAKTSLVGASQPAVSEQGLGGFFCLGLRSFLVDNNDLDSGIALGWNSHSSLFGKLGIF